MSFTKQDIQLSKGALAGTIISNFTIFAGPLFIGSLVDGLGFSEVEAGLSSTLEIGAVAITCLLLSSFLPRLSLRYLAMSGAGLALLANLACMVTVDHTAILVLRTLAGIGAGFCLAATSSLLGRMADPDRMVAIMMMITVAIMMVVLTVLGYAKEAWLFGGVVGVYAVLLMVLFPLFFFLPLVPHAKDANQETNNTLAADNDYDPKWFLGLTGVGLLILFCVIESSVWAFSERSASGLGISDTDIGMLLALSQFFGLLGGIMPAIFGKKIPFVYPISLGGLMMGVAGLLIYQTSSELVMTLSMCAFGFGFFMAFPYLIGSCAKIDEEGRWAARAISLNLIGGAVAPFVAGGIVETWGYAALGTFCFSMAMVCIAWAVFFYRKMMVANPDLELEVA